MGGGLRGPAAVRRVRGPRGGWGGWVWVWLGCVVAGKASRGGRNGASVWRSYVCRLGKGTSCVVGGMVEVRHCGCGSAIQCEPTGVTVCGTCLHPCWGAGTDGGEWSPRSHPSPHTFDPTRHQAVKSGAWSRALGGVVDHVRRSTTHVAHAVPPPPGSRSRTPLPTDHRHDNYKLTIKPLRPRPSHPLGSTRSIAK